MTGACVSTRGVSKILRVWNADVDDSSKTLNDFDLEEDATEPDVDHA